MDPVENRLSRRRVAQLDNGQGDLFISNMKVEPVGATFSRDARLDGQETQWAAAKQSPNRRVRRSQLGRDVVRLIRLAGAKGLTDSELAVALPQDHPGSVSKRRCDAVRQGLVRDSGRTRKTKFGAAAIVWVAA